MVAALRRDGAVVVRELAEPGLADAVAAELRPKLNEAGLAGQNPFDGNKTRRFGAVMRAAPSAAALVDHEMLIAVADEILLPHCATYQVGSLTAIEILPGEGAQALHRDDSLYPIELAGMELQIGVMWALNDFTSENGGTRVVPGLSQVYTLLASPGCLGVGVGCNAQGLCAVLPRINLAWWWCK